ncbi:MAG: hypothetical protein ACKO6F_10085 [Cyanobium sp.]
MSRSSRPVRSASWVCARIIKTFISLDFRHSGTVCVKIFGVTAVGDYDVIDGKVIFDNEDEAILIDGVMVKLSALLIHFLPS